MKKYITLLGAMIMVINMVGCNNGSMDNILENEPSITGIVTEISETYIKIRIKNYGYPKGAECEVSLDTVNEGGIYSPICIGDEVVVYYDGFIAESNPMQIKTVYAISLQSTAKDERSYKQISMDEAMAMMKEETDYIILDVRTPQEFAEKHIPNAINVPNETIGEEILPELPRVDQLILVYCRSGNRSKQASEKLVALGYTNVYEFGGINDWKGETESE